MEIKVLGRGCTNCQRLLANVKQSLLELQLDVQVQYITDDMNIADHGILKKPGLIINQTIVSTGKVLSVYEIKHLIETIS